MNPNPMDFSNDVSTRQHPITVVYKECLKNHVASLGGHVLDGCGEFMPSSTTIIDDLRSIKCAACGCHQNFHRCEPEEPPNCLVAHHALEYQPHQRTNFTSPQPISIYPPAHHMVPALDGGLSVFPKNMVASTPALALAPAPAPASTHHTQKLFRTKFTLEQKDKMYEFSKKLGWKMQKLDKEIVKEFCNEVGVCKQVLKVWMHNNKNSFEKRYNINVSNSSIDVGASIRNCHVHDHEDEINGKDNLNS